MKGPSVTKTLPRWTRTVVALRTGWSACAATKWPPLRRVSSYARLSASKASDSLLDMASSFFSSIATKHRYFMTPPERRRCLLRTLDSRWGNEKWTTLFVDGRTGFVVGRVDEWE